MDKDVGEGKENGLYSPTEGQGNGNGPEAASALNEDEAPSTKLCGYLHKLGGPLKTWKSRWFTYEEMKCQLYYYRTPQDVTPLGSIELIKATFGYPTQGDEGTFHIQIPERLFVLKALNRETMMYWLQQLQLKRWQHSSRNADVFLPTVKTPTGLVGEEAAALPAPWQQLTLQNISLKHPLTELQNSVHNICNSRSFQEYSHSASHAEEPPSEDALSPSIKNTAALPAPPENPPPPAPVQLTEPEQEPHQGGRRSPCSLSWRREKKISTSATLPVDRKEANATARVSRLQQEVFSLQEDLKSQKELVLLLHKALEAAQQEKRTCTQFLSAEGEQERLELRHIADLEGRLEAQRQEKTELEQRLGQANGHVTELQEHVQLMMEKNHAKQEVILKLSGQVTAFMDDPRRTVCNTMNAETFRQMQEQIDNLKDDIEAYKIQNKFLNSEIYQLTNLWRNSSEQEKGLMMKCAYLEAKNCQIESKYLVVLRKLQESKSLDSQHQDMVKQLIEDALQGDMKDVFKLNPVQEYDEYGFKIIPEYEVGDMKLLAKIQALEIRNHNLLSQDLVDKPLLSRWANYLGGRPSGEPVPSPELKGLIRCGVPREYREQVWRWVIQLDLHRTLTSNRRFASPTRPAVQQLRRILMAFSWQNPTIGYCQGLNRLAAIALLVLNSEEDAFWCLVTVVETIMPQDYYNKTLIASQADQRVLKDFMAEKMPRLTAHFEQHNVDVSLITFNWFLVVFVESLASDILLRLWDAFLYEGTKVIFRYALALFKYKEDDILKIHDSVEIYQYLRFFTRTISDGRKLMNIAFNDMNPFPMKLLRNRRFLHREKLRVELRELEKIQEEFVTKTVERKDKELDTVLSDDEEDL
ncbi:TBD2A protein, partial [Amia calva]|nr:TBD2A protein [Amia calva]